MKGYTPEGCTKHRTNKRLVDLTRRPEGSEQVDEVAHAVAEDAGDQHEVVHVQIAVGKEVRIDQINVTDYSLENVDVFLRARLVLLSPEAKPPRLEDAQQLAAPKEAAERNPEDERVATSHAREVQAH